MIALKRAYEAPATGDGYRVLVERLWPRGVRKEELELDQWAKQISPSPELRKWYAHDPAKWDEFVKRYTRELQAPEAQPTLDELAGRARRGALTLVFAAKDPEHSSAAVLKSMLEQRLAHEATGATKGASPERYHGAEPRHPA